MRLLYLSCHITLEHDDVEIFSSLGFSVVSVGNFLLPKKPYHLRDDISHPIPWSLHDWKEPTFNRDLDLSNKFLSMNPNFKGIDTKQPLKFTKEFLDEFDAIVVTYTQKYLTDIIELNPRCPIIHCTVGHSSLGFENFFRKYRSRMKLVRYCQGEEQAAGYAGADAFICASISDEFLDAKWTGSLDQIMTVSRAMRLRSRETNYETFVEIAKPFNAKIFGSGNESIPESLNGGALEYEKLLSAYKDNRVFITTGSCPGPIVYTFIEAIGVGIPTVSLGQNLARKYTGKFNLYAVDSHIVQGENGFYSNNISELQEYIRLLRKDYELCKKISKNGKLYAEQNFSRRAISSKWKQFFIELGVI